MHGAFTYLQVFAEHAMVGNSFAAGTARLAEAGLGPWKAAQERQTGLATTAPRVHDTEANARRHAGDQCLDDKAADEQAVDFCFFTSSFFYLTIFLDFF